MKGEEVSILSLARKDSENNKVLGRFCPILPLLPKLIWSCLKPCPTPGICNWMFQSHMCDFCAVLPVCGLKTKVIYSFQIKYLIWQKHAKYKLVFISAWPSAPDVECSSLCGALFVEWCSLPMQWCSCQPKMPLGAGSTPAALSVCPEQLCLRGVCVLLPQSRWGWSWLPTQVALAALNWFALKQRGSIHLFSIALGCEPRLGPVCCSCDLREWIFLFLLSLECLKQPLHAWCFNSMNSGIVC